MSWVIFDHQVTFVFKQKRKYNPLTHKYEGNLVKSEPYCANITDVGTNRSVQLFGNYQQEAKVVRLTKEPPASWDYLTIDDGDTAYVLQTMRKPLKYFTLIVGESNGQN